MTKDIAELLLTNRGGCDHIYKRPSRSASRLSRPMAYLTSLSRLSPELQLEQIT